MQLNVQAETNFEVLCLPVFSPLLFHQLASKIDKSLKITFVHFVYFMYIKEYYLKNIQYL